MDTTLDCITPHHIILLRWWLETPNNARQAANHNDQRSLATAAACRCTRHMAACPSAAGAAGRDGAGDGARPLPLAEPLAGGGGRPELSAPLLAPKPRPKLAVASMGTNTEPEPEPAPELEPVRPSRGVPVALPIGAGADVCLRGVLAGKAADGSDDAVAVAEAEDTR